MFNDSLDIGGNPNGEDCVQVSSTDDYAAAMLSECKCYARALRVHYGEPPEGARIVIASNPHDFGSYRSVMVRFNSNDPEAVAYAYKLEEGLEKWSDVGYRAVILKKDNVVVFNCWDENGVQIGTL